MANENLIATIDAVRNSNPSRWNNTPYQNRQGLWGWHIAFWNFDIYHSISIHNCPTPPSPQPLANAIKGIEVISDERWGVYGNRKRVPGFYATARSTRAIGGSFDHWFMIGRSGKKDILSAQKEIRSLLLGKCYLKPDETDLLQYLSERTGKNLTDGHPLPSIAIDMGAWRKLMLSRPGFNSETQSVRH